MNAYSLLRKFLINPAGNKPPPEPKSDDPKEDVEMGRIRLDMVDPDDAEKEEGSDSEQLKKSPQNGKTLIESKESESGPPKKRRKIANNTDEEDVKSATIPAKPAPKSEEDRKLSSHNKERPGKVAKEAAAESPPSDEDTDPPAAEDEPELDMQSEKKAAEKL